MKIVAGLGSIDEYIKFAEAGADEFFCGYVPFSWAEKYGTVLPLNRREVLCYNVQLGAFSELENPVWDDEKVRKTSPSYLQFPVLYPGTISRNCRDYKPVYKNRFSQLYYCRPGVDGIFT